MADSDWTCSTCGGTRRIIDPNISEGIAATFTLAELEATCSVPCPKCECPKCMGTFTVAEFNSNTNDIEIGPCPECC